MTNIATNLTTKKCRKYSIEGWFFILFHVVFLLLVVFFLIKPAEAKPLQASSSTSLIRNALVKKKGDVKYKYPPLSSYGFLLKEYKDDGRTFCTTTASLGVDDKYGAEECHVPTKEYIDVLPIPSELDDSMFHFSIDVFHKEIFFATLVSF